MFVYKETSNNAEMPQSQSELIVIINDQHIVCDKQKAL